LINNRQAGRRRGRGGNNGGNNGPRQGGGGGQRDTGNRIDSRARGNASQLYEKYKNLAADSQRQGDRVNTEYYLQFADHYFRVLSESRSRFEEQNQQNQQRRPRDDFDAQPFTGSFDSGFDSQDDDYADEGEPIRAGEQALPDDGNGDREGNRDGNREPNLDGNRNDERPQRAANGQAPRRDDRSRDDRPRRDDRQGGERHQREQFAREFNAQDRGPQDQAPREEGESYGRRPRRYREESAPVNGGTPEVSQDVAVSVAAAEPASAADVSGEAEAPRRRGRPRRERPVEEAPAAFDAALLPPSIGVAPAPPAEGADAEEKPRRRRVRATPPVEATPAS
jgi:hypothetical protein